jgi:K+-sensing histidine kinase KdpD
LAGQQFPGHAFPGQSELFAYVVPVLAVSAAVVVTLALGSTVKHTPTLFICAVGLSSWFGGIGPGIFAGLLSAISLDYYFIPPIYALGISLEEAPDMIVFGASAVFVSWSNREQKRSEDLLSRARYGTMASIRERTAELRETNQPLQAKTSGKKIVEDGLIRERAEATCVARSTTPGEMAHSICHGVSGIDEA